jgi:hypothetical protein
MNASAKQITAAFTEWDRQYRENPEGFQNEVRRLTKQTPKDYGELAAPYFLELLKMIKTKARKRKAKNERTRI